MNPYTTTSETEEIPWWRNESRPCKDRPEYADTSLIHPSDGMTKRMLMREYALSCKFCPVLKQCAADMLTHPDYAPHGIRAGKIRP